MAVSDRVIILNVAPDVDHGRYASKAVEGDVVRVTADILTDGHERLAAVVQYAPPGRSGWTETAMRNLGNDR